MAKARNYKQVRKQLRAELERVRRDLGVDEEACLYLLANSGERLDVVALGRSDGDLVVLHLADSGDHIARAVISHVGTLQLLVQIEKKTETPRPQFRFLGRRAYTPRPGPGLPTTTDQTPGG